MKSLNVKQALQNFINIRKEATIEETIDYLDYVNKVRYSRDEVIMMLAELINGNDQSNEC